MNLDTQPAIAALLRRAGEAHGEYETRELGGVYDRNWPQWYAHYVVEHGLGALIGRPIGEAEASVWLIESDAAYNHEHPSEGWPEYYARRIVHLPSERTAS